MIEIISVETQFLLTAKYNWIKIYIYKLNIESIEINSLPERKKNQMNKAIYDFQN